MTQAGQNDHRYDDATKFTKELADKAAGGGDALPLMAIHLVKQSVDGVFDTEPNKHGKGVDDAKHQFGVYAERVSKKSVHDRTGDSVKTQISKARQFIKMGMMTTCDAMGVMSRAQVAWNAKHKVDPKTVKPAYAAYCDVARMQQTVDVDLTDEQIDAAILKPDPKEQTIEGKITAIQKAMDDLISGEKGMKYQEPAFVQARGLVNECLAAFTLERETLADQAEIARLTAKGYNIGPVGKVEMLEAAE